MGTSLLAGDGDIASDWIAHVQRRYSAPIPTLLSHLSLALRRMKLVLKEGIFFFQWHLGSQPHAQLRRKCAVHFNNPCWKALPEINKLSGADDSFLIYSDDI